MKLETERLVLRPWEAEDAESLFLYAKDPEVGPSAGWPVHNSVEESRTVISEVLSKEETYAVVLKESMEVVGSIGLISPMSAHKYLQDNELEIGYWIGKKHWGKGFIPEAVREIQRHAFDELKVDALWCGYYEGNEKSRRVQEKCGFTYDHTEYDVKCPMINDIRTEIFTKITKNQWEKNGLSCDIAP